MERWGHRHIFLSRRSHNPIERQQVIVYLIATALVVVGIPLHFLNVVGVDRLELHLFSALFFIVTLIPFALWCGHRLGVTTAFTTAAYAVQAVQSARILYIALFLPKGYYYLVIVNGLVSLILVFLLAISYLRLATAIVGGAYLLTVVIAGFAFGSRVLWQFVALSVLFTIFLSLMSDMMYRNIKHLTDENIAFRKGERQLLQTLRLNRKEVSAYIEMCRTENPDDSDTDRLFSMLSERSQRNVINAVERRQAIEKSRNADLQKVFPDFTPMETEVTRLVLRGMMLAQIVELTGKSESNISVVRSRIRKKLGLAAGDDLREALEGRLEGGNV